VQARPTDAPRAALESQDGGRAWHTLSAAQVLRAEKVDGQRGLSSAEAAERAARLGLNRLAAARAEPGWHAFIRQYSDPMQIVLLAAGVFSLFPLRQLGTGVLLVLLTLANAALGLQQEGKVPREVVESSAVYRKHVNAEIMGHPGAADLTAVLRSSQSGRDRRASGR
jgi:magnesium-transporting ATPase (P-type)